MPSLHIEHPITDLSTWLAAFNRFHEARTKAGARSARVHQPVDDDHFIYIDLDFDTVAEAGSMAKAAVLHYSCSECGYSTGRWLGRCPSCASFGTLAEEGPPPGASNGNSAAPRPLLKLAEVDLIHGEAVAPAGSPHAEGGEAWNGHREQRSAMRAGARRGHRRLGPGGQRRRA